MSIRMGVSSLGDLVRASTIRAILLHCACARLCVLCVHSCRILAPVFVDAEHFCHLVIDSWQLGHFDVELYTHLSVQLHAQR